MIEGSGIVVRRSAGQVLRFVLNGDKDNLIHGAQMTQNEYFQKMNKLNSVMVEHITSLSEDEKSDFFESIALELFNDWAKYYSKDMYDHAKAAVTALKSIAEETITERVKRTGQIYVLDFAAGDGNILAYYLHLLRTLHEGISINLIMNDLSPEMTALALSGNARYECLIGLDVKPLSFYNPIVKHVNIVAPNALNEILGDKKVDVVFSSQILDVIRGFKAKRKHIKDCHSALESGGRVVVIGEDPSLFTLSDALSVVSAVYFGLLHNNQGMGLSETTREFERISDNYPFHEIAHITRKIENAKPPHVIFDLVVEKSSS